MIGYVKEKDENLLNGISKRKEKLKVIIKKFNFKDIRYMRNAIDELNYKYYKIMIESKDERILDFMINHLFIRNEIKSIYLDSK